MDGFGGAGTFTFDGGYMVCGDVLYAVYQNAERPAGSGNFASGLYSRGGRRHYADSGCLHSADYDLPLYGAYSAHGNAV